MCEKWEGMGVTIDQLREGTVVAVPVGQGAALVEGQPCIVALATVMGPADEEATSVFTDKYKRGKAGMWWLNVHMGPGVDLPQMYAAEQILGVPALGLTMAGGVPPGVTTVGG